LLFINKSPLAIKNQIFSIQLLRAIAVCLVAYAHSIDLVGYLNINSFQASYKYLENFGAIGVDIFFIISGFIMVYVSGNIDNFSKIITFFKKRMIRLYTLYIPLTFLLMFYKHPDVSTILKNILLLPIFDTGTIFLLPSINIAWTLSFELFFYIIFTISLIIHKKMHNIVAIIILLTFVFLGTIINFNEVHLVFLTNPILLEFVLGIILGLIYTNKIKIPLSVVFLIFITAILQFVLLINNGYSNISEAYLTLNGSGSFLRVYLWGIPSFLLVTSILFITQHQNQTSIHKFSFIKKIFILIGDASYSIYLIHTFLFSAILHFNDLFMNIQNGDLLIFLFLSFSIFLGCLIYIFIEDPLLNFCKKKLL
jgi:exopolysaccharide production protein ExoZ